MKKVLLVSAFAVLALASCKKDYACECTSTDGSSSVSVTSTIKDAKKKDAEAACDKLEVAYNNNSVSCKLK